MTEIVLVRHGETQLNTAGVFRGRTDVPLNERGVGQAEAAAVALADPPVAAVYSSPMVRALDTARAIASKHGLEPVVDEAFNNIHLGEWQGARKEDVMRGYPELWKLWLEDPDALQIPGGETLAQVRERSHARTVELAAAHADERIVMVSHRSVTKLLGGALLGLERGYFWSLYIDNAAYSVFGHDGVRFLLLNWNVNGHLGEKTVEFT